MPCQTWSTAGYKTGENSLEGALYIWQAELILELSPEIFYLEQSPNVRIEPSFQAAYLQLKQKLATQYTLHEHDIKSWVYGDPQNRVRLYIVGVHNKHGEKAKHWKWAAHTYDADRYPIAADIAVPDAEVPREYWLKGGTEAEGLRLLYDHRSRLTERVKAGHMDVLASWGEGMGDRARPHKWQSWYGLLNTQLASNGGGQRPSLLWKPGMPLDWGRALVPKETIAAASFSDTYEPWIRSFCDDDRFIHRCINNAIPMRTGCALMSQIHLFLKYLGVQKDIAVVNEAIVTNAEFNLKRDGQWECRHHPLIRSKLLDTGAQMDCDPMAANKHLEKPRKSNTICAGVTGKMPGHTEGWLRMLCLNTDRKFVRKGHHETQK